MAMVAAILPNLITEALPGVIGNLLRDGAATVFEPLVAPLREEIAALRRRVVGLEAQCERQESQDRRSNLIFRGIPEPRWNETWEQSELRVRTILREKVSYSDNWYTGGEASAGDLRWAAICQSRKRTDRVSLDKIK